MRKLLLLLCIICTKSYGQFVGINDNNTVFGLQNQNIRPTASTSQPRIDQLLLGNRIVCLNRVTGDQTPAGGNMWYSVDIPTSGNTAVSGFVAAGFPYIVPLCNVSYATINNPNINYINIRSIANESSAQVTIDGANARVINNQKFALVSTDFVVNGSYRWYQIYLTGDCSQQTGWIAGYSLASNRPWISINTSATNAITTPTISSVSNITSNSATLSITNSLNHYYKTYSVYLNGSFFGDFAATGTTVTSQINLTGLASGTSYSVYVIEKNNADCSSAQSQATNFSTTGGNTCSYNISPISNTVSSVGGTDFSLNVIANSGCNWSASASGYSWITITSGSSGSGNGVCLYSVSTNTGSSSRTGFITIAGQSVTIIQNGTNTTCAAPTIVTQPSNVSAPVGTTTGFGVAVTGGTSPYSYQWQVSTNGGTTWSNISAAGTNPTYSNWNTGGLSISNLVIGNNGFRYRCIISSGNPCTANSIISNSGVLTVTSVSTGTISINYSNTVIPPWQRENDNYEGYVSVNRSNSNASWHLEVDVLSRTGVFERAIIYPSTTTSTQLFNTATNATANNQLKQYSVEGKIIRYYAVLENTNPLLAVRVEGGFNGNDGKTNIIEKKWTNKNYVLLNETDQTLEIPIKYEPGIKNIQIVFCTDGIVMCLNVRSNGAISFSNKEGKKTIQNLSSQNMCSTPPRVLCREINADGSGIFCQEIVSRLGVFSLSVGPHNNLNTVKPGEFKFTILYYDANFNENVSLRESGNLELTKVGKINVNRRNRAVVFVGGFLNTIETDIKRVLDPTSGSNDIWSLAKHYDWANLGFDTWYIDHNSVGYIQRNGFAIGSAIDKILLLNSNYSEINIVAFGKAGLDTRALLSGYSLSYDNFPLNYYDFGTPTTLFNSFKFSSKLKKVLFLGTPHNGTGAFSLVSVLSYGYALMGIDKNDCLSLNLDESVKELTRVPGYRFINLLNDFGRIPNGVSIANLTGYMSYASSQSNNSSQFSNYYDDGIVPVWSSDGLFLKYQNGSEVHVKQLYQHSNKRGFFHPYLTSNSTLRLRTSSVHDNLNCITSDHTSNLSKIFAFFAGTPPYTYNIPFATCTRPSILMFSANVYGSTLPGASVYRKISGETEFNLVGVTDENGKLNKTIIPDFQIGDTLKVISSGYENLSFPVNEEIITTNKINISLFKSIVPSNKVIKPTLKLVNQTQVSNSQFIEIEVTGANVNQFFISSTNNSYEYAPLQLTNNKALIRLDTGFNNIKVMYVGNDTAFQERIVYYFPANMSLSQTYSCSITLPKIYKNKINLFVNNQFYSSLSENNNLRFLNGFNELRISSFGFKDTVFTIDSSQSLSVTLYPKVYTSKTDSAIAYFGAEVRPFYWKNISLINKLKITGQSLSIKQNEADFHEQNIVPLTRKFVFKNLKPLQTGIYGISIILDQIETANKDSIYFLLKKGLNFSKYDPSTMNFCEYDPVVQKVAFDSLIFNIGETTAEFIVAKKQKATFKNTEVTIKSGEKLIYPIEYFISDPDSIKNDIQLSIQSNNQSEVSIQVKDKNIIFQSKRGITGAVQFTINATHDFLKSSKSILINIDPPDIPINTPRVYPNPTLNMLNVEYILEKASDCDINIYNKLGQLIKVIKRKYFSPGYYTETIDVSDLPSGVYIIKLNVGKTPIQFIKQ